MAEQARRQVGRTHGDSDAVVELDGLQIQCTATRPSCMRRLFAFLRTHLAFPKTVKHDRAAAPAPTVRHERGPAMDPDAGVPIAISRADDSPRPLYWAAV